MTPTTRSVLRGGAALLAATGLVCIARYMDRQRGGRAMKDAALESLPYPDSTLTSPSPEWDAILGGAKGPGKWSYYEAGHGTTCGIVAAYWAARAGWPREWINRAADDPVAPGGGFNIGAHISKVYEGARRAGWLSLAPVDLQPGDYYAIVRENATYQGKPVDGTHVGVVLDVSLPDETGKRTIITADGGQTCGENQCARRNTRTLTPEGMVILNGAAARLAWIVRAP